MTNPTRPDLEDRLWPRIDKNGSGGCWIWTGGLNAHGYGQIRDQGRNRRVHRVVWELIREAIPVGAVLCHTCDIPACCNPEHLFVGSMADNSADMVAKGRQGRYSPLSRSEISDRLREAKPKRCPRCGQTKQPDEFGVNKGRDDGLQVYCQLCLRQYAKQRRTA